MLLTLLRHGVAVELLEMTPGADGRLPVDAERPLTERGRRRLKKVARALRRLRVRPDRILHSGLVRAKETAEIVADGLEVDVPSFVEVAALLPEADPAELFELLRTLACEEVLCVGHAPHLDRVVAAVCGAEGRTICSLGKAGAAQIELPEPGAPIGHLVWVLPSKILRRIGE
ncbi:MAG TPA: histidine phosphatase family protein [Planctomycetota bacterium]|jgi:phosphohistidine phosphatase|nr:histidine phosphatase family protein [Planctomycetota bacterium]